MTKVCLCITYYKRFLEQAAELSGTAEEYPKIKDEVLECINSRHFVSNKELIEIISPFADLIGHLEKALTNICDIVVQFLKLYICYKKIEGRTINGNPFVHEAIKLLSKRFKQYFMHPIYDVSLFLSPIYRNFAISKQFSIQYVKREVITLAMMWKFTRQQCQQIAQDMKTYAELEFTESQEEMSPSTFWKCTLPFAHCTRTLSSYVFRIKGHAAPVETLFSSLSYSKPKIRNKISSSNLKIIGTIRKSLKKNVPRADQPKKRLREATSGVDITNKDTDNVIDLSDDVDVEEINFVNAFDSILEEDDDFSDLDVDLDVSVSTDSSTSYYIDKLFNIDLLDKVSSNTVRATIQTETENTDDNIFTLEDILPADKMVDEKEFY